MPEFQTNFRADQIASTAYIAPTAVVIGDVTLGADSSIWFQAVVRGDTEAITIGEQSNIQDLALLHADRDVPCRIGNRVTMGHAAIAHGAIIEDDVMLGMRSVVLNHAQVGTQSIVAAGTVIPEGTSIPPRSLVMGVPGKVVREISDEHLARIRHAAQHYTKAAAAYRNDPTTQWSPSSSTPKA